MSDIMGGFSKYSKAEEVALKVKDFDKVLASVEKIYKKKKPKKIDWFDGLGVDMGDYWFSVRKSGTEYALKVNLEAVDEGVMKRELKRLVGFVKNYSGS